MNANKWMEPFPRVLMYCSISKPFCHQKKALDLSKKMRYILWMVALEACDVTMVAISAAILDFTKN